MAAKIWSNGWTSVTARCYSSVLFGKQRKIYPWKRCEKKISQRLNFGSCFCFFLLPLCKLGLSGRLFVSPEILTLVLRPPFALFLWGFSFLCLWATTILDTFSYSNYLTFPLKRWEAQFFGNRGIEVSLATSCWTGWWGALSPPASPSLISFLRILMVVSI